MPLPPGGSEPGSCERGWDDASEDLRVVDIARRGANRKATLGKARYPFDAGTANSVEDKRTFAGSSAHISLCLTYDKEGERGDQKVVIFGS